MVLAKIRDRRSCLSLIGSIHAEGKPNFNQIDLLVVVVGSIYGGGASSEDELLLSLDVEVVVLQNLCQYGRALDNDPYVRRCG